MTREWSSKQRDSVGNDLLANYTAMSGDANPKSDSAITAEAEGRNDTNKQPQPNALPREIGGRDGPEPTRFGDWEKAGRCIDF